MNTTFGLRVLGAALAGVLTFYSAACSKPEDRAGVPVPGTTVGIEIDDSVITSKVKSALLESPEVKSLDFKVETRKGEVQLSGFVDSQTQIDRAVAVTYAVAGVKNIDNKMSLKDAPTTLGNKVDDAVVTAEVKAALIADASVKSLDIGVITRNGEVQLSGFVDNQGQIDRAMKVARGISRVQSVSNDMSIKK